jgi:hypothetical protein
MLEHSLVCLQPRCPPSASYNFHQMIRTIITYTYLIVFIIGLTHGQQVSPESSSGGEFNSTHSYNKDDDKEEANKNIAIIIFPMIVVIWCVAFTFASIIYSYLSELFFLKPLYQKLEHMYKTESYRVEALVLNHVRTEHRSGKNNQSVSYGYRRLIQYQAQSNTDAGQDDSINDTRNSTSMATSITVEKLMYWKRTKGNPMVSEVLSGDIGSTVEIVVLKGFPLTGLDPKFIYFTKVESISPFKFLLMVCFIGLPLHIGILATPTPFLYIFLVVHTIILPTYWYLRASWRYQGTTLESFRKRLEEKATIVESRGGIVTNV